MMEEVRLVAGPYRCCRGCLERDPNQRSFIRGPVGAMMEQSNL